MLYAIVDPSRTRDIETFCRAVLRGGASMIQLRDKSGQGAEIFDRACRLAPICSDFGVPFIVNDRLDVALAASADGVHLGPGDLPIDAARRVAGRDFIIGGSAGTPERARRLEEAGADYLGVGAIFEARPSKSDASAPRGPEAIAQIVEVVDIGVYGIGGITVENAPSVVARGAAGVAVIRALVEEEEPEQAARRFCEVLR